MLKQTLLEKYPENKKIIMAFDDKKTINVVKNNFDSEDSKFKRRTPITKQLNSLFGKKLTLKEGPVNDLYCALVDIDARTKEENAALPFIGMALRLLIEIAARVYYKKDTSDQIAEKFLKEAKKQLNQQDKNNISLTNEWLSDKMNLNAILQKYAHGNITYTRDGILTTSKIVADILEHYFKK